MHISITEQTCSQKHATFLDDGLRKATDKYVIDLLLNILKNSIIKTVGNLLTLEI